MTAEQYGAAYGTGFPLTVRLLLARGLPAEDARETAQAAWAKGWERRYQLRKPEMVGTWVNTIALNGFRSIKRSEPRFESFHEHPRPTEQNLAAVDIRRMLGDCRENDREILECHYLDGLKVREIAQQYELSETAVRIRLLRARRNLRKMLDQTKRIKLFFDVTQQERDELQTNRPVRRRRSSRRTRQQASAKAVLSAA
jgi:RNA polymerase sigma factor (sigma-70 family)